MTYTKQLKAYEDGNFPAFLPLHACNWILLPLFPRSFPHSRPIIAAVIAKRFEELQADEVEALLSDMESDKKDDGPEPPVIKGSGWRPDQY